jgi:pyrimidine operon attenuation protein/uracil phosphoribosyltransferase
MMKQSQRTIPLSVGHLELIIQPSEYSLGSLLEFASRENPKRAYLFVSKVLGKYIPCKPSDMRNSYRNLIEKINVKGNVLVVGVAETATGLGAGIAEEIGKIAQNKVFFAQTTRFRFDKPLAFSICEKHSHAPTHQIYDISQNVGLASIEEVILVDDEISTGKTLCQLTTSMCEYLPNVKRVNWASLVNWMGETECKDYQNYHDEIELQFYSLLRGEFSFTKTTNKMIQFPKSTAIDLSRIQCRHDLGRTGIEVRDLKKNRFLGENYQLFDPLLLSKDDSYVVVGTGEFTYQPFLFAEAMELAGYDVIFESTGRSPIMEGGGISNKLKFYDPGHEANFYLYNLPEDRVVILLYETREQFEKCPLHKLLNCQAAFLEAE